MKEQLCGAIDQQANATAAEATRWLDDAASKVDWCKSFDDTVDREGVDSRQSAIGDLCSAWADGESLREDALHQIALAAKAATDAADKTRWLQLGDDLKEKWDELDSQLKEARWRSSF